MDQERKKSFVDAVEGENKERDFLILHYNALNPEQTATELILATGVSLSEQRVGQILKTNSLLLLKLFALENPLYFKEGRAMEWTKMYKKKTKGGVFTGKDPGDCLEGLRKEIEGDNKTSIGVVIHNKEKDGEVSLAPGDRALQERIRSSLKASRLS